MQDKSLTLNRNLINGHEAQHIRNKRTQYAFNGIRLQRQVKVHSLFQQFIGNI